MLDTAQELQSLRKTLREAGRKLVFRAEVATVRNFRFLVTLGCRMLHYTGHGNPSCLIFENDKGEANPLDVSTLTELFRAGGVRTQLVFVSACHSEVAGHSFAQAGVPHVVAVKFDEKVTDYAARIFAEQFYLSLVTGNTVRNAFQIGVTSVMADGAATKDQKKFLLLPEDGNHDVSIFNDAELGVFLDETPKEIKNTVNKPPVFFLGRNSKVQEVVSLLHPTHGYRCVTIRGKSGIGKTAIAFRVCEYMAERRMFDAVYQVPLHETQFRVSDQEALCEAIGTALEVGGARTGRDLVRALQGSDPQRRVLLLLDGMDRFLAKDSMLVPTLSFLLSKHAGLHLLLTAEGSLHATGEGRLENTPERVVTIKELSDLNAAHLLVYLAPRRLRYEEMATKPYSNKGEALSQLAASAVMKELHGHPKAIVMFAPLLETNRLEHLTENAKQCYADAIRKDTSPQGDEDGGAKVFINDPACDRIWRELTSSGNRRHISMLGVPWYSIANSLQQQLRETLVNALINSSTKQQPLTPGADSSNPASGGGADDIPPIRALSECDIGAVKSKMMIQPNSFLVRLKDFQTFCEWWVPTLNTIRLLSREWVCDSPPLLYGFASRTDAETMLFEKEVGTFLVRFSTTHLGLLAISFVTLKNTPDRGALDRSAGGTMPTQIQHCLVQVFCDGCDLFMGSGRQRYTSFKKLIEDCKNLVTFHPGVPKEQALQQLR